MCPSEVLLQEKELALEFSSAPGSWDWGVGGDIEFREPWGWLVVRTSGCEDLRPRAPVFIVTSCEISFFIL